MAEKQEHPDEEDEIPKKQRSFCSNVLNYFREYCDCTSIHGFRYFGEKRRTVAEKIWWFFTFSTCLAVCVLMIIKMYDKWQSSPVIVSFATRETPIYEIPFAAVTICPESKFSLKKFNYTAVKKSSKRTQQQEIQLECFSLLCDSDPYDYSKQYFENGTEFFTTLHRAASEYPFAYCQWMGDHIPCTQIFKPLITDEGVCYTFNTFDADDLFRDKVSTFFHNTTTRSPLTGNWSLDFGYNKTAGIETYPRRALFAGALNSLEVHLHVQRDGMDYTCKQQALQGFKVSLHIPQRLPRVSQNFFRVPVDQSVVAAIRPTMMKTSEDVQRYEASKRECYFPWERYLGYFKNYTQLNCEMECLRNYTEKRCGCVPFFMPREATDPICGPRSLRCVERASKELQMAHLEKRLVSEDDRDNETVQEITTCDCLPMCTDLSFDAETSQTDWDWEKTVEAFGGKTRFNKTTHHISQLKLFFKSSRFITSERNELYGPMSFLANFGGIIGLFTGFSILSVVELVYFLSLRIICNLKIYGSGNWSGRTD